MGLNEKQLKACFDESGKNILVSAAAGSGKTMVLVERILHLIVEKNISLSDMVIMTFTKKATSEMKKKIKAKLEAKLAEDPKNESLIKESAILPSANISTIDSFCKRILEEYYNYLNDENSVYGTFDPAYRIADEKELNILYSDVLDDLLEKKYGDKKYRPLFDAYIEKSSEHNIKEMLLYGLRFLSSITWPDEFLERKIKNFEIESQKITNDYINEKINEIKSLDIDIELADQIYEIFDYAENKLRENKKTDKSYYQKVCDMKDLFSNSFAKIIEYIPNITDDKESIKKASDLFNDIIEPNFPNRTWLYLSDRSDEYILIKEKTLAIYEKLKCISEIEEIISLPDKVVYNTNEKLLLELLLEFYLAVVNEKKQKNMYAISDYAALSLDILYDKVTDSDGNTKRKPSEISYVIADKFKAIFIDEYQDTNYIQEEILRAITKDFSKNNLFMVGDIKQSIYGFRDAEPDIFYNKYKTYSEDANAGTLINLDANYRSRKPILQYVNDLFSKIMHEEYGKVNYEKDGYLGIPTIEKEYEKKIIESDKVEIDCICKEASTDDKEIDDINEISYEADFIARKVEKLVKSGECRYRDIVVLLRSTKGRAEYFLDAFSKRNIPAYSELNKGFFNRFEVKLLISILRVIDNPLQNIELASVLTSSIYNVRNNELALLKIIYQEAIEFGKNEKPMLYDAVRYFIEKYDSFNDKYKDLSVDIHLLKEKIEKFDKDFSDFTFKSRYLSISELINLVYEKTCIKDIVASMLDGKMRKANLDILYQNAKSYESSSYVGLFNFLRYIEKILSREDDQGQAKLIDEYDDVVRIMTIHTSKGLEFPVVFLANASKDYNDKDVKAKYFYNKEFGIALNYIDDDLRYSYATPKMKYAKKMARDKIRQEEMRMLYVALTRAESKLYITSFVKDGKSDAKSFNTSKLQEITANINAGIEIKSTYDLEKIKDTKNYFKFIMDNFPYGKDFVTLYTETLPEILETNPVVIEKSNIKKEEEKFIYNFDYLKMINPKFAVTTIKQLSKPQDVVYDKKLADEEDFHDGTAIGTLYHRFMQFFDYEKNAYSCMNENVKRKSAKDIVDEKKIEAFLNSEIGKKMASAFKNKRLYREHKFMKLMSQDEVNEYLHTNTIKCSEKNVIIQGIIDAFIIDKDENGNESIILVDYKTDKILNKNIDKNELKKYLINNYKIQLDIYAKILEELTNLPVKEKYIYSFALDEGIML